MKLLAVIFLFVALQAGAQNYVPDATTLNKKVMFGYKGGYGTPNDGSGVKKWSHYFDSNKADGTDAVFDIWPDMSEYPAEAVEDTNMKYADGTPAKLYSAYKYETVDLHFKWMRDYELDGVFDQRPLAEIQKADGKQHYNQVVRNIKIASEKYRRVYCIMYDITGAGPNWKAQLMADWMTLVDALEITNGSSYLHHNGKPVLGISGLGLSNNAFATAAQADSLINWLHTGAPQKYRATLVGGVNDTWLSTKNEWSAVYNKMDVISPWSVGKYNNDSGTDRYRDRTIVPDMAYCNQHNIGYMPVLSPGLSESNKNHGGTSLNQTPRMGGYFYWRAAYNWVEYGAKMLYIASFDGIDDGTAVFKIARNATQKPATGKFMTAEEDGLPRPPDWYLKVVQTTSNIMREKIWNPPTIPESVNATLLRK